MLNNFITKCCLSILVLVVSFLTISVSGDKVMAWIGASGGGTSSMNYGGGVGYGCVGYANNYGVSCAGVSWAFYKSTASTSQATTFENRIKSRYSINATPDIPSSCSTQEGGGFYHLGINLFDMSIVDYGGGPQFTPGGWYGHWLTVNAGFVSTYSVPYVTRQSAVIGNNKQKIGVYQFDSYISGGLNNSTVLEKYNQARQAEGLDPVSSMPSDVWGFCWWPGMEKVSVTAYAIDEEGHYINVKTGKLTDNEEEAKLATNDKCQYGKSCEITAKNTITGGYTFNSWRTWTIKSQLGNKFMDVAWGGTSDGTNIWLYSKGDEEYNGSQRWQFIRDTKNTYYKIFNPQSGKTANLSGGSTNNESNIQLYHDDKTQSSQWILDRTNGGMTFIRSMLNRNKVMDAAGGKNDFKNGQNIQLYSAHAWDSEYASAQKWILREYIDSSNLTYKIPEVLDDARAYAVYKGQATFQGKTNLSGTGIPTGEKSTAGWTEENKSITKTVHINNCSPTNGCKVNFKHSLKRVTGSEATSYKVTRTSNLTVSSRGVSAGTMKELAEFSEAGPKTVRTSGEITLYPGMVVCERLTFKPTDDNNAANIYTEVCASALGKAQCTPGDKDCPSGCKTDEEECDPEKDRDPTGANSLLNIKVRNNDVTKYNKYQKEVYAKPGDKVNYRARYYPQLQYTYYLVPQKMQIDGKDIYPTGTGVNKTCRLGDEICKLGNTTKTSMFNYYKNSGGNKGRGLKNWNNDFSIQKANKDYGYDNGNAERHTENTGNSTVKMSDVGTTIEEKALTNSKDTTKTTPSQVVFTNRDGKNLGNVITSQLSSTAYVRVPYNFINTASIDSDQTVFYAGEKANIKIGITVNPKPNKLTTNNNNKYATSVASGKYKFRVCIGGNIASCPHEVTDYPSADGTSFGKELNVTSDKMLTGASFARTTSYNVPDVSAGTKVCVASMVYPANSGADNNWNDKNGNGKWASSTEACFKVAKKPSIQIWGGNIYSRGNITTATSTKYNLNGYSATNEPYVFGSWGELGLIAGGVVQGLASGAGLGYSGYGLEANPGGNKGTNYCIVSRLSFANDKCSTNKYVGLVALSVSSNSSANVANKDRSTIKERFGFGGDEIEGYVVDVNDESKKSNENVYYYYKKGDFSVNSGVVKSSTIQVMQSEGTITINGNITYENISYKALNEFDSDIGAYIPKLVIVAKNIHIVCGVKQIDALLVADEVVDTCSSSNDINAKANSNQLKVNGAIVSGKLRAKRTYGAATGSNTIVPAEIINFDPTLYLWGNLGGGGDNGDGSSSSSGDDDGGKKGGLDVTYTRELAPRE